MTLLGWPNRDFKLWGYTVGMGRLLLRSVKDAGQGEGAASTRIDVLFQGVAAIQLPTSLPSLRVARADMVESALITKQTSLQQTEHQLFFAVSGREFVGYVVAAAIASDEDEGEYYESSKYWPVGPDRVALI
jgi:hypothetical protein